MLKVSIFGSCVSADAVYGTGIVQLDNYLARSSLGSQVTLPSVREDIIEQIGSPFQRRIVRADMEKALWDMIRGNAFDLLLMDFIDDRFNLLLDKDGSIHTLSNEYASGLRKVEGDWDRERVIPSYSNQKWELWKQGWAKLLDVMSDTGNIGKLVVNQVWYASRDSSGNVLPKAPFEVENGYLRKQYDHILETRPDVRFLTYEPVTLVADTEHKWGISPFHYVPALYEATIRQITMR
ncbi:DUF6270 domain-containing protein [Shinella pollutisoli]|uniref:DUF6270 domain-containing protein n=1 Tax=Shinella pollutisoli TaxID=2250594 RepID=A0ABV7DFF6_9HYPH|nr:DUF6270 domain-containing protein [Shinella pollutisoli]